MVYRPSEGEVLTVALPNEAIRATVSKVVDKNTIEAILDQAVPFTRIHGYNFKDRLRFKREGSLMGERWSVVDAPPKAFPAETSRPKPRMAPPDDHPETKTAGPLLQKGRRRSDVDAEKPKTKAPKRG